jgi:DNA-directed RNA polymerase subunit RPC12/RpoP
MNEDNWKMPEGEYVDYKSTPGSPFYRCTMCRSVVSVWDIEQGGCGHCGSKRVLLANLSLWEKLVQIFKHPKVWQWPR